MAARINTRTSLPAAHLGVMSTVINYAFDMNSVAEVNTICRCRNCSSFAGQKFRVEGTRWINKTEKLKGSKRNRTAAHTPISSNIFLKCFPP